MVIPGFDKIIIVLVALALVIVGVYIALFPDSNVERNKKILERTGFSRTVPSFMTTKTWCRVVAIWVVVVGILLLAVVVWSSRSE